MSTKKLLDYFGWAFLIVTIILLKVAENLLDNIIEVKSFLLVNSFYGFILSSTVLLFIYKMNPMYFKGGEKRASAILSYFFGIIMLFVFGISKYNLETAKSNTSNLKAFVSDKYENVRYRTMYLVLKFDNRTERFQPNASEWQKVNIGDTITLTVGEGELGYKHILEFPK